MPGASDVFRGSIVSYASEVKFDLLGVSRRPGRQRGRGAADGRTASANVLGADVGLALTGVAGPAEQDDQPVGTLFVGLVGPGFDEVRQSRLPGQREQMRQFAVITALGFLREHLQER